MKSLVPWDPLRNLLSLQDRMNQLFDETLGRDQATLAVGAFSPAVDIYETEGEVVLTAEIPGVEPDDVALEIRENTLTLKGERRMEKSVNEESYHRVERAYGSFMRSFTLPSIIDQEKISARFTMGLLEVRMPKIEAKKTRINIQVGKDEN